MTALSLVAFNRGLISPLALARTDFDRTRLSAEVQTNWMPRVLGSMMLRPGWQYTGAAKGNSRSLTLPFIFSTDDTARLELTDQAMRVWVDDELVARPSVSTAVTNGTFNSDLSSWTDQDGGSAVSEWATGGYMSLIGTENAAAKRRQQVTVSGSDQNVRHALNIVVERGPVLLRVGSSAGDDDYISETSLRTGRHSLAFTPTGGSFWIDLFSYNKAASLVDSVTVASPGTMELAAPWTEADLSKLRWDQSGDIVFVACDGYRQRQIERRAEDSWSIVVYDSDDGPFMIENVGPVTITPSATSGDVTLTASSSLFRSGHLGALFKLTHSGQSASVELTGQDQFSDPIRVTGIDGDRAFAIIVTGTWSGTITLQYSVGSPGVWVDAASGSYTSNVSLSYDDTLDNQVIYYRIGFKSGNYVSGTASATLSVASGTQTGIARITGFTNGTTVSAAVLEDFGASSATSTWSESYWSDYRGYPSSVALHEGRLCWSGKDRVWLSISDSYWSFDPDFEGDAGTINRSIGSGPVDTIYWLVSVNRLLMGAGGSVSAVRSTSFDEPLTPTNYNRKDIDTPAAGAANVAAVKSGTSAVYVQQAGARVFQARVGDNGYDYQSDDLTVHVPEVGQPGIVKIVEQNQPELRRHCIRSDGTVAVLIYDKAEDVKCWIDVETSGEVEDAVVLPGTVEDQVYYTVKRTIGGEAVRYHEKWALESECVGGTLNKQADAFVTGTGDVLGLDHLEGEEVVVWANGEDVGTFTVSSGGVSYNAVSWVAGLSYDARYKSTKLAYGVEAGTALCMPKRINRLGLIARNLHPQGIQYGPDFDTMDDLPLIENGTTVSGVWDAYDEQMFSFPGDWDTDSRLCLKAAAPRPATVLAAVMALDTNAE